jgi:hypothetical protein
MEQQPERYRVTNVFLERTEKKDRFRIRAIDDRHRTVELSFPASKLGAFRALVDSFHDWQKRGWNPEGTETREATLRDKREHGEGGKPPT